MGKKGLCWFSLHVKGHHFFHGQEFLQGVYVCMYFFMYACMYVYISVCMNVSMYGCRFRYQNVSIFVYMPSQYYNPILIKFIFYQHFKGNLNFILHEPCKVTYSKHLACFKIAKPNLTRWVLTDALGRLVFQYTFS